MATFGELVPGPKLRKVTEEDAGTGQAALPRGPLDLDSGVVFVRAPNSDPADNAADKGVEEKDEE